MKSLLYSLIILCIGCNINPPKDTTISYSQSESKLWSTYTAQKGKKNKHVVLVSGDEEYRSEEALPQLAKILNLHHGFHCIVLFAQHPDHPGVINPNALDKGKQSYTTQAGWQHHCGYYNAMNVTQDILEVNSYCLTPNYCASNPQDSKCIALTQHLCASVPIN